MSPPLRSGLAINQEMICSHSPSKGGCECPASERHAFHRKRGGGNRINRSSERRKRSKANSSPSGRYPALLASGHSATLCIPSTRSGSGLRADGSQRGVRPKQSRLLAFLLAGWLFSTGARSACKETVVSVERETRLEPATPYLEGRVSRDRRSPGMNLLLRPIELLCPSFVRL